MVRYRDSQLVDSVQKLSALRQSSAVISIRHGHVYHTHSPGELALSLKTKEALQRLQETLVDKAHAGRERG